MPIIAAKVFGDPLDAIAGGRVAIAPLPPLAAQSPLDNEDLDSPDLLAGEVPMGENPTDLLVAGPKTDALGNPIDGSPTAPTPKTITVPAGLSVALPAAPIAGLTRQGTFGPVPKAGSRNAMSA